MDFYFTDRKYNLLGIASTDPDLNSDIVGIGDIAGNSGEYQSIAGGYRSYSGTVYFDETVAEHVKKMCAFGNFVLYKDRSGESVWLTILTSRYDALTGTDEITAEDASIDLINGTVTAYKATTPMTITDYVGLFAADSGFEIGVNEAPSYKRQLEWDSDDSSILTRLLSVATQFDVEISFRFEVDGLSVVHKYIDFRKRIGDDNGITLYTNVSLNKIVTTTDGADLCTSIVGTGATPEGANQPISLKGYSWTDPDGRFVLDKDGVLRDPVALRTWSRLLSATNPAPTSAHIVRHKTYEAATQATLLQSVLADLKKYNHPAVNYEVDIDVLPENVHIGDTITLVDEAERLNLSARVLELRYSYSENQGTAVLGDYLLLADQVDPELRDLANSLKQAGKLHQYWPWTRYADDDTGKGISALPAGKAYMAVIWNDQSAVPSDDPADYAGKWQKVKGDTGVGEAGPKGADGRTSYFHTAWANDVSGQSGFTVSGGDGKKYIGTCSDFTLADSTNPADYNWALFKGEDGSDGVAGKDGVGIKSTQIMYAQSTSDTTAPTTGWTAQVPTLIKGQYLWTQTTWLYTDNTGEAGYTVSYNAKDGNTGSNGIAGKDGVGIKSTTITYQGGTSGTVHPTGTWVTNPPSVAGGNYLWTRTVWSYTDGTSETGYSVAKAGEKGDKGDQGLQGLQGPQGPAGNDITSYASGTVLPAAIAPANSQFWLTNSAGVAIKFYKSTGTAWVEQQISAAAINAATFNGLTFNGVTFNGSTFKSTYNKVQPTGAAFTVHGTSTLSNGALSTIAYKDSDNSLYSSTGISPVEVSSVSYDSGTKFDEVSLRNGQLYLGGLYKDSASSTPYWEDGVLTPAQLLMMQRCGTKIWTGALVMNPVQSVTPTLKMSQCLNGWALLWSVFYGNGQNNDSRWFYQYVSKNFVASHSGQGVTMSIAAPNGSTNWANNATKYLYFTDSTVKGYAGNNQQTGYSYALREIVAW